MADTLAGDLQEISGVQNLIRERRAYNALRAMYGDIAGDPERAGQLQAQQQNAEMFPFKKAGAQFDLESARAAEGRNAAAFPLQQQGRQLDNTAGQLAISQAQEARQRAAAMTAVRTLKGVAERGGDVLGAFDRIATTLPALGVDPSHIGPLRGMIEADPMNALADIENGLMDPEKVSGSGGGAHVSSVQPAENGRLVAVMSDGTVRDLDTVSGRYEQGTPGYKGAVEREKAIGKGAGGAALNLPAVEQQVQNAYDRMDEIENDPNLDAIFGLPSFKSVGAGGFGAFGELPGSPAADVAAKVKALGDQLRFQAFETLKGGGSITETESEFAANAYAALMRAQSAQSFRTELGRLRAILDKGVAVQKAKAAMAGGDQPGGDDVQDLLDKYK